jgi:putative endonuclease
MAQHNDFGKEGEALALEFLRKNDFEILHCNWRYSRYEIDIIAKKQSLLHIIEVKKQALFCRRISRRKCFKKEI